MTRIFMRAPEVKPNIAKQVLGHAGVKHIAQRINVDPKFIKGADNHTTIYIVFWYEERHAKWLRQMHDLLRTFGGQVFWFHSDAVLWSTRPYDPRNDT